MDHSKQSQLLISNEKKKVKDTAIELKFSNAK
jgi:hypothetical protein